MSWDSYRDSLLQTGHVEKAAVCGLEDGGVWTRSPDFNVSTLGLRVLPVSWLDELCCRDGLGRGTCSAVRLDRCYGRPLVETAKQAALARDTTLTKQADIFGVVLYLGLGLREIKRSRLQ